jgi:cytochrome oxidase Cu insertion factor (SCO1/SenC/PrrC family)
MRFAVRIAVLGAAAMLVGAGVGAGIYALQSGNSSPVVRAHRTAAAERLASAHRPAWALRDRALRGQATWPAGAVAALPIRGRDQTGHEFSLSSLRGRTVAVAFFDSHCHAECPLEGRALASAERTLRPAQRPVLVAVSVNPRDTPASARAATRAWGLSQVAPWHWVMGKRAALEPIYRAYHIYVGKAVRGDIQHTEALILVDRRGYERSGYLWPFATRFVNHDLRVLAR